MSTAISKIHAEDPPELMIWDDEKKLQEIRKLFAPKLSDMEFKFFVGLGKASRLNPFTREIWAVKYQDNAPAQVFIGRDGYRKAAQAHNDYDFHQSDAVYENDEFEVVNGEVHHKYKLVNRGALVGAYCIAKRHKSSRPMYVFADLKEYSTGKSLWNPTTGKPATMIKKVAESQCLRACFQDLLGGTYGEEEVSRMEENRPMRIVGDTQTNKLKQLLGIGEANGKECDIHTVDIDTGELSFPGHSDVQRPPIDYPGSGEPVQGTSDNHLRVSREQLDFIEGAFVNKGFSQERIKKALDYYKVETINDLSYKTAQEFISQLERV